MTHRRGSAPREPNGKAEGFTLIEVLVVAILMMIIIGTVAVVFGESTEIIARNEARTQVYVSAGYAIDRMTNDFFGCLPFTGAQRFVLHNGVVGGGAITNYYTSVSGGAPETAGSHTSGAADLISFRAVTSVANGTGQYQVTYFLKKDTDAWRQSTARTARPIYTLMRRVTEGQNPGSPAPPAWQNWAVLAWIDADNNPASGISGKEAQVTEEEVCHYVLSFNVEYLANTMKFSQLDTATTLSGKSPCPWSDPLGDGDPPGSGGVNDTPQPAVPPFTFIPYRVPAVRVTLIVVDDFGERSERLITHVFEIPMG